MDTQGLTKPENLVKYSFYWSVTSLIATGLLYLVSTPWFMFGYYRYSDLLNLFWFVAGAGATYLLYMWSRSDRSIFGGADMKDKIAFWFLILISINQGLLTMGIGLYLSSTLYMILGPLSDLVLAVLYGLAGYYLLKRWKETNGGMVDIAPTPVVTEGKQGSETPDSGENQG